MSKGTKRHTFNSAQAKAFGGRLRVIRLQLGMSMRALASKADISHGSIEFYESGMSIPTASILERLADVLGLTMDQLWKGVR